LYGCGQSRIFGLAIHGSTENGARPARRPPGLDAQSDSKIVSGKSHSKIEVAFANCTLQRLSIGR
jgi:hypothetical protein